MVKQQVFNPKPKDNGVIKNGLAFKPFALREGKLKSLQRKRAEDRATITPEIEKIVNRIAQIQNPAKLEEYSSDINPIVRTAVAFSPFAETIREGLQSDDNATVRSIALIPPSKLLRIHDDMTLVGLSPIGALRKMMGATNQAELNLFFKELHAAAHANLEEYNI
ncbi:hypothetical protein M1394_01035, partial [Candidatus Marsarchaeota archaeon]|nr:hypothetical protein [Candidatus Marsarchaeota archaeon]